VVGVDVRSKTGFAVEEDEIQLRRHAVPKGMRACRECMECPACRVHQQRHWAYVDMRTTPEQVVRGREGGDTLTAAAAAAAARTNDQRTAIFSFPTLSLCRSVLLSLRPRSSPPSTGRNGAAS
jgi:hypothetical protein